MQDDIPAIGKGIKDCFEKCQIRSCGNNGRDVKPLEFCKADRVIDRYENNREGIKFPCNSCSHYHPTFYGRCWRCLHGESN